MCALSFLKLILIYSTVFMAGVNAERGNWDNITNVEKADRNKEIVRLCWDDESQSQVSLVQFTVLGLYFSSLWDILSISLANEG